MDKFIKVFWVVVTISWVCILSLYGLSFWAIGKLMDRTACYRATKLVQACEQPGAMETEVRKLLDWVGK